MTSTSLLRVGEEQVRDILDGIPARVALLDRERRHCYVNQEYARFVGKDRDDILGRTIAEVIGAQTFEVLRPHGERALAGETVRWSGWLPYWDGKQPRYVQRIYTPFTGPSGTIDGYLAFSRDLTDLKRGEEQLAGQLQELQVAHAHLKAVLDSIPGRAALLDREERHRYANREYCEFVGISADQVIGMTRAEVVGKRAAALIRPTARRALAGETVHWEGWVTYRQGRRYVERVNLPHRNEAGEIDGYFNFTRDLTDLKRSEERLADQVAALRASEALNAAITASVLDCIVVIDETGAVVEFNPAAERTFGYARSYALGRQIGDLIVPEAMRQRHADGFARYLRTGERRVLGRRLEMEAMRAGGELFPVELTITEVKVVGRRLFAATLRDLTDARAAAAELQRSRDAMHQNEKMAAFGSLLAGVAHELNNPLSIVIGNALMLQDDVEEAGGGHDLAQRAEKIQLAAERCGRIVRTFLAMARERQVDRRPVELGRLVDGALDLLGYGLRTHGVEVVRRLSKEPCLAVGDPDQIGQVLTNLLINAQQALEAQPLPRRVTVELGEADGWATVRVSDNGPGVPSAIRGRIFDPFFTTKPMGSGTGIGLAVSRGIAQAHGGSLELADAADATTCFVLRLPRAAAPEPAQGAEAPRPAALPPTLTALVVDDEAEIASVLLQLLARQGFRCDVAGNGAEAQALVASRSYDLVLCDLHMPGTDGPAFFDWLAAHRPELRERVAFVTGDTLGASAQAFLARAGRPVVEKPFHPDDVARVVQAVGQRRPLM